MTTGRSQVNPCRSGARRLVLGGDKSRAIGQAAVGTSLTESLLALRSAAVDSVENEDGGDASLAIVCGHGPQHSLSMSGITVYIVSFFISYERQRPPFHSMA